MIKKFNISYFLIPLLVMPILAVVVVYYNHKPKEDLNGNVEKIYGSLPQFELIERNGEKFNSKELSGKIWVANFVFSRCSGVCPIINRNVKLVQQKFSKEPRFRLISFSVDPQHDTPEVLRKYADRFGADEKQWLFLTGERSTLKSLMGDGFSVVADGFDKTDVGMITHSDKLVLVDGWGRIRGYFDGTEQHELKKLARGIKKLLTERF